MEKFLCKFLGRFVPKKCQNMKESSTENLEKKETSTDLEIIEDISIEKTPMNSETFELAYANGTSLKDGSKLLLYENHKYKNLEIHPTEKEGLYKVKLPNAKGGYQFANEKELLGQIPCIAGSIKRLNDNKYKYVRYYYDDALSDTSNSLMTVAKIFDKADIVSLINAQGIVF